MQNLKTFEIMNITLHQIKVSDLVKKYTDNQENGVRAYDGQLDVRPPYQREFVYKDKQRDAVIETLTQGFPLNVMYWAVRDLSATENDGSTHAKYEIIDGQQRLTTLTLLLIALRDFAKTHQDCGVNPDKIMEK